MTEKPSYEELEQRVKELEEETVKRDQVEKVLRETEAKFQTITDTALDSIFCKDINRRYTFVSPSMLQLLDCTEADLIGKVPEEVFAKEGAAIIAEVDERALNGESIISEVRSLSIAGKLHTFHTIQVPSRDSDGNITGISGIVRDITDFVQAEEALRESKEFSSSLLENSPIPIVVKNSDASTRYVNPAFEKLTGYTSKELASNHPPYPWWIDDPRSGNIDERNQFIAKGVKGLERLFRKKDGELFWVELTVTPIRDNGDLKYALTTWVDVTKRKKAEEKLQKAHDELERRVEERTAELDAKNITLEEMNISMRILLDKREEDKKEMENKILLNMQELVIPYLAKLKGSDLNVKQNAYANVLESNLNDIFSPLLRGLSSSELKLTPQEIMISSHIRQGMTTKEVAELLGLSRKTIESHRKNIRSKFGIQNRNENLRTHLMSIQ
ncbi:MAG: PAS domain S-box protein [Deltaproteobacteria bacterium]|nr:PAS domain S-box protein [Deltaproteobacteria bacterium]